MTKKIVLSLIILTGIICNASALWLRWDWTPSGPVWFEVYHSTNLATFKWTSGTNIPAGFTFWTNVLASPVPIPLGRSNEFFIVRAANSYGVSDWPK